MENDRPFIQNAVRHFLRRKPERLGEAPLSGAFSADDQNHTSAILSAKT